MRLLELVILVVAGVATPPPMSGHVTVADPWFRALPANLPAGGYFSLHNTGRWPARLTGTSSLACGMLMLHKSSENGGMSRMEDVSGINVPAGGVVTFAPGGYHLMCMKPTSGMKPGASLAVTLKFSDGSATTAHFAVKNAKGE
jgi:periplasmic copper chaperone A